MTIGFILLILTGLLILFGAGQRVLDRLRLTDRQAILFIALIIAGGFVPDIPVTDTFAFNIGGALVPLALCVYLWTKADTFIERARSLLAALLTGVAVFSLGRLLPSEPENMAIDPIYAYGIAAGLIAYVFGRSRRGAFIAGTVGVMLADLANWGYANAMGARQRLALGGAGGFDAVVIAGLLAVLISELLGEILERASRGRRKPTREFRNGDFVRREQR
ncbi:MAG: DUF1614 domain-containing protein [Clostridia bacterium]|nr:DUF1614 domain-containing protein [Clostridia bacterium]